MPPLATFDLAYLQTGVERDLGLPVDSDELEAIANRVYGEEIPARISGAASKRTLVFPTVAATADYDLVAKAAEQDFMLWGVRETLVLLDNQPIWYSTDPEQFWLCNQHGATSQAKPAAALLDAFTLTLYPVPSGIWNVKLYVHGTRGPFPQNGITRQLEADAIQKAITFYMGTSLGMDDAAAAAVEIYNAMMKPLHRFYHSSVESQPMQPREF